MEIKEKIYAVLIFVAAVILATFLVSLFTKKQKAPDYEALIKAKDETIQSIIRERDTFREWKDKTIELLQKKDSVLKVEYKTNKIKIYEKIPVYINSLGKDSLRAAVYDF